MSARYVSKADVRPPRLFSVKSRSQSVAAIVAIDDELWSRRPCNMKPGGWRQLHPAGPHSLEATSALSFPYMADEIMCVMDAHTLATVAAKTMKELRIDCLVFNPLNEHSTHLANLHIDKTH